MDKLYGLIFDVDGVIADTEAINARVSIKVFTDFFGVKGVLRKDFEAGLGRAAEEYVKAGARIHGLELTKEQINKATQLRQQYFLKVLNEEPLGPLPGVLELMKKVMLREDWSVRQRYCSKSDASVRKMAENRRKMAFL